jgi:hypothetical protein
MPIGLAPLIQPDAAELALAWTTIYVHHFAVVTKQKISSTAAAKKSEVIATF